MIVIRPCRGLEELQACVDLQVEVWGYCDGDVIPRRMFLVAQKIGGQVIGAFETAGGQGSNEIEGVETRRPGADERHRTELDGDAESMVGFAFGLPGVKTGAGAAGGRPESYLHSHMLAVREGYRNQSVGARLKLAQRDEALKRGIRRMEWTFDPTEIKNSFLNIHKLGAIVRTYAADFYGVSSSRLQGGLPTDRLVAEWWLDSPRVIAAIDGTPPSAADAVEQIMVPAAIYQWKADEKQRPLAIAVQAENRRKFQQAFSQQLAVIAFTRDAEGNGTFHLGHWTAPPGTN